MTRLQIPLVANATFSLLTGLACVLLAAPITTLFGLENTTVFWVLGAGLVLFSGTVFLEAKKQRPLKVLFITVQDLLWVIGSAVLLIFQPFGISAAGNWVIDIVAILVLAFAIGQMSALAQVDSVPGKGIKQFVFSRTVPASKAATWAVVSDVANYHQVAPNIDAAQILSGAGQGMVRRCSHGKDSWTETCTLWNPEDRYAFEVNTQAPDYPYPLKSLHGLWQVGEVAAGQTRITMTFEFAYKRKLHNLILHPFIKARFSKVCDELLDNWARMLQEQ